MFLPDDGKQSLAQRTHVRAARGAMANIFQRVISDKTLTTKKLFQFFLVETSSRGL